jgi:glutamate synthase (NADPH/NADH) large chain
LPIYDTQNVFASKCNTEMVDLDDLTEEDVDTLKELINKHFVNTGSEVARTILENWSSELEKFVKVFPRDYKKILLQKEILAA